MTRATRMPKDQFGASVPLLLPAPQSSISSTYSQAGAHVVVLAAAGNEGHNTKPFRPSTVAVRIVSGAAFFYSVTADNALSVITDDSATISEIHHFAPANTYIDMSIINPGVDPPRWPYIRVEATAAQKIYITEME